MLDKLLGFIGLPSSPVLLGVLIALVGTFGYGYHFGDRAGRDAVEARYSEQKDRAAEALREQLALATQRAVAAEELARKIADQGAAFQSSITPLLKGIRDGKAIPVTCVPDDMRLRLNAAVRTINDYGNPKTDFSVSLPAKLPTPAGSGG